ncbi:hypothetical protein DACRYDRAFT_109079 [Dacryopinax primogenitus]|uniref:Uncharacterized protein n=1 Tax=Dacryopinax primogenitus (strain DJM 731) TaxID=1858805 RepID=M5G388_DACPD|nr:uncharacterized protein DACRYDRAFT_109079 [Dacryopinax primogenitus]EJU00342.1 hypothetical protein DACRYDRAFT_109079 [Dacryopinax primogenitus]
MADPRTLAVRNSQVRRLQSLDPDTFSARLSETPPRIQAQSWGHGFNQLWRWMRLVGVRAALSCLCLFQPPEEDAIDDVLGDWHQVPADGLHYILFAIVIAELNRQARVQMPLDAVRVGHDLVYQFMTSYHRYRHSGRLPHLDVPFSLTLPDGAVNVIAAFQRGLTSMQYHQPSPRPTPTPAAIQPGDVELTTVMLSPPVSIPEGVPTAHQASPSADIMRLVGSVLRNFSIPDTLGSASSSRPQTITTEQSLIGSYPGLAPQIPSRPANQPIPIENFAHEHDRPGDFPQSPSTHSWHPSQLSDHDSMTNWLESYADRRLPVQYPLPDVADNLPEAFHVYFYEEGSDIAIGSTLKGASLGNLVHEDA